MDGLRQDVLALPQVRTWFHKETAMSEEVQLCGVVSTDVGELEVCVGGETGAVQIIDRETRGKFVLSRRDWEQVCEAVKRLTVTANDRIPFSNN